jgi:hypothetical protein
MGRVLPIVLVLTAACTSGSSSSSTAVTLAPQTTTITSVPSTTVTTVTDTPSTSSPETTQTTPPPVTPLISFEPRTLTFVRQLRVPLWATADPDVPIAYRIVPSDDAVGDDNCLIDGTDLVFVTEPNPPPAPARCAVEASTPGTDAVPVTALVEVGFANWAVEVAPIDTVDYSNTDGTLDITIFEDSGSAYGITVDWFCGSEGNLESATPNPSDPGTTEYSFNLTLPDPAGLGYTCRIDARAEPQDHYGGKGDDQAEFEVVP